MAHAESNQKFWDEKAATYDENPWQQRLSAQLVGEIRRRLDFIGVHWSTGKQDPRKVRLLDYACGTGMVSRALAPYVNDIRGIDISPNMVEKYNDLARASELAERSARAVVGDLFTEDRPGEDLTSGDMSAFDVAAVGLGFHHFDNAALAISRLSERLEPGGVVLIIDLVDDGQGHASMPAESRHTIKTHGFSEADMRDLFEKAGMDHADFSVMEEPIEIVMHHQTTSRKVFLARAMKPVPVETL